jgi:DNA invertase Pin-like site-specific DNA recombinase
LSAFSRKPAKADRIERKKVMGLAQARAIDSILVAELSRWGRSTIDLVQTLQSLQAWNVSVLIGRQVGLSKNTDAAIVQRARSA